MLARIGSDGDGAGWIWVCEIAGLNEHLFGFVKWLVQFIFLPNGLEGFPWDLLRCSLVKRLEDLGGGLYLEIP